MKQIEAVKVYWRLLRSIKPYLGYLGLSILGLVALAVSDAVLYKMLVPYLIDKGFIQQNPNFLYNAPLFIILLFLARGLASFVSSYFMSYVARATVRDMRQNILEKIMVLPSKYFINNSTGKLISKVNYDSEQIAAALSGAISDGVRGFFIAFAMLAVMFSFNVKITLIVFLGVPPLMGLLLYVSYCVRRYSTRIQGTMGNVTKVTGEVVHGSQVIRVYAGQKYEAARIAASMKANFIQEMKMYLASTASIPAMQFIGACSLAALVYCCAVYGKDLSPGAITGMFGAMLSLLRPIKQIASVNTVVQRGIAAAHSIYELLDEDEEESGTEKIGKLEGNLKFENVTFSYPVTSNSSSAEVLNNVSIDIPHGNTVALVGGSGAGKSTIIKLLLRFYELNSGVITIDGHDISSLALTDLRKQYSYVSQDITLFDDTIYNNIAYGSAFQAKDQEIISAAAAANVMEFAKDLPEGLHTVIGENGNLLSGGQRQRVAIARAILKNASVLLLDEATSALDNSSEVKVQEALEKLREGRTTVIVAHRLSTVINADKIVVLHGGSVVEQGTHSELINKKGSYYHQYTSQLDDDKAAIV